MAGFGRPLPRQDPIDVRPLLVLTGRVCAEFGYEPPGYQFVSPGGLGKSTVGRIAGTPWGGSLDPTRRIGCGVSWNQTNINLEIVAAALNQMLLFLDDMHRADKKDVEKIIEIMNGEGRGRSTETQSTSFCVPVASTSNRSVVSIARNLGMMDEIEALIDRLADIPLPSGCPYMFEGIRTSQELRDYGDELRRLSLNFGWAGPEFVHRFGGRDRDRPRFRAGLRGRAAADVPGGGGRHQVAPGPRPHAHHRQVRHQLHRRDAWRSATTFCPSPRQRFLRRC